MELVLPEHAWPGVMARLHNEVGTERFEAFFQRLRLDALEGATARISVPTPFLRKQIEERYRDLVLRCVKSEVPYVRRLAVEQRSCVLRYSNSPPLALLPAPGSEPEVDRKRLWSSPVVTEIPQKAKNTTIIQMAAEWWGLPQRDLVEAKIRTWPTVIARQTAMYAIRFAVYRKGKPISWAAIGRMFGGRDHTTALHAIRVTEKRRKVDPYVDACIVRIFQRVGHIEATP